MSTPQTIEVSFEKLEMLAGDEPEFMIEILEMILAESPEVQAKMDELFQKDDHMTLASTAHKYKSSVNVLGNSTMDKLLKDIENTASGKVNSDAGELAALMQDFQQVCNRILDQVKQKLSEIQTA